ISGRERSMLGLLPAFHHRPTSGRRSRGSRGIQLLGNDHLHSGRQLEIYRGDQSCMFTYPDLHRRRSLGLLAAAVLFCRVAAAQTGLGLAPMRLDLNLAPGAVHSGVLTVANNGGGTVRAAGEMLDFFLDETATPQFGRDYPREAEFSCRTWLVANPM